MSRLVAAFFVIASLTTSSAEPQSLRELARQYRGISGGTNYATEPVDMPTLIGRSKLVARVTVTNAYSRLSPDEQSVITDYTVLLLDVEHSAGVSVRPGEAIVVSRVGGEIFLEGYRVRWEEGNFPNFLIGDEYVLFLGDSVYPIDADYKARYADMKRFRVLSNGWGAFKIGPDSIQQVTGTEPEGWNAGEPGAVSVFCDELRSKVAQVRELAAPR
jgi:hypothetical protein